MLVEYGDLAFLEAVDALQVDADFENLPERYGADIVQQIMADAFGGAR